MAEVDKNDMFGVDRVTRTEWIEVGQLLAHPDNFRVHGKIQQDLVHNVINDVGWVRHILVNEKTGRVVDGHLRITLAFRKGENTKVPVDYVELTDGEEALLLSLLDETVGFAFVDSVKRDEIIKRLVEAKDYSTTVTDLVMALDNRKKNIDILTAMSEQRAESSSRKNMLEMFDKSSDVLFELVMLPDEKKEAYLILSLAMSLYNIETRKDALLKILKEWSEKNTDAITKENVSRPKRVRKSSGEN